MCNRPFQQLWYRAARLAAAQPQDVMSDAEYSRDGLRAAGVAGSICSVLRGPDGPQAQQVVVAGDQRQIHDLNHSREKPVSRVAVRQRQLLSGQYDLVSLGSPIRANRRLLGSHLVSIEAAGPSRFP